MPDTPFPLGEPLSLRSSEVCWFEPVVAANDDDDPAALPQSSRRIGEAVSLRDVHWVGFAGGGDLLGLSDRPDAGAPRPDRSAAPADAAQEPIDGEGAIAVTAEAGTRRRLAGGAGRLVRTAVATVLAGVLAVLVYKGGEELARFAGAMPHPAGSIAWKAAAPAVPQTPLAAAAIAVPRVAPAPLPPASGPAVRYLARAEAGEPAAQYDIAVLYTRGDGVARDLAAAASWFRKAALAGNPAAAFDLGVLYERGVGVERNADEAVGWYRRAAAQNYPPAQYNLAVAYAGGSGTPQDWVAAASWYHQAALRGVVPAMVNFAILYEEGDGVERSLPDAYAWYRAAARRGDAVAEERAHALFGQLAGPAKGRAVMLAAAVVDALREQAPPPTAPAVALPPGAARAPKPGIGSGGGALGSGPGLRQPSG